ncbi:MULTISPECIES: helix-turn-helix domain-containing protein [Clostridium]|uniref:Helix-turn-helix domain-containing protein n=2 Tax=Clostridium TaxID=1485 RepID=D8GK14_CLOLD|nr:MULTISPECIES: helix-turn-helix domain-containing protein [Clostridium]ADK13132.1 hypothetical protein CLJU_c00250 [Clostridium ljungdahlii DSM 13528]AGY76355.1 helix-turn-helix domain-containing protein [Clostridium autoethanogenum DSM 10061]ALU36518.1 Hypothetical protein CLAU_2089 [Clostridium autoethanogenum DSM 10061]OAA84370.1 hypothetical protein WX45_01033 [Clostridium ljungdahlii DSM 13528]OVY48604.1 hypothetical protein WX72_00425 [Clostridium autoethanogenum]
MAEHKYKILDSQPSKCKTMTVKDICREYDIGVNKAYSLAHMQGAPVIYNGNRILFIRSKVDEWICSMIGEKF